MLRHAEVRLVIAGLCGLLWLARGISVAAQGDTVGWQPLGGPAGRITHLAAGPTDLFVVSVSEGYRRDDETPWLAAGRRVRSDALYRSTDGGASWMPATNSLPPGPLTALYVDPVTGAVFVGWESPPDEPLYRAGLWRSRDGGMSWHQVWSERQDLTIRHIVRATAEGDLWSAATDQNSPPNSFVLRSSDDGQSWEPFEVLHADGDPGRVLASFMAHATEPNLLFVTTQGGEVYHSPDAAASWTRVYPSSAATSHAVAPTAIAASLADPDHLLLVAARGRPGSLSVARSTDRGRTWTAVAAVGLPAEDVPDILAALPGGLYLLSTDRGTYRSADNGATWQALEGPISTGGIAAFALAPPAADSGTPGKPLILAATAFGLFVSRDGGALWEQSGAGLPFNSRIVGLLTDRRRPERLLVVMGYLPGQKQAIPPLLLRSLDSGRSYAPTGRGWAAGVPTAWALDPQEPDTVLLATARHFLRSTDAGLTWQATPIVPGEHRALVLAPADPRVIYLGGRPALRSTDGGANWQPLRIELPEAGTAAADVTGIVVDPRDAAHLWAGLDGGGVWESQDGGESWRAVGLAGARVQWLAPGTGEKFKLYAGLAGAGIQRWDGPDSGWTSASAGLPADSTILSFVAEPQTSGALWTARDGGGVYRSTDGGTTWANVATTLGDNLAVAVALDPARDDGVMIGTANAGVWASRTEPSHATAPERVDARIEVVWPHGGASVAEARRANIGLRLFAANSLLPPPCNWSPRVTVWRAVGTSPAEPLGLAQRRQVDGQSFPFWELNDVDVSPAADAGHTLYFMARVAGVQSATSVWAHGSDTRTYFPQQDVPSGTASGPLEALDARIQIVWPHNATGELRPVTEAPLVNVAVALFKHGTRLSVPVGWEPAGITLYGAWNHEVGRPLAYGASMQVRRPGAVAYPVWEFSNISVERAMQRGEKLHLWVQVEGIETYPTIWTHGVDARTAFPSKDEPIQGCVP